jgi:hypothetical protein
MRMVLLCVLATIMASGVALAQQSGNASIDPEHIFLKEPFNAKERLPFMSLGAHSIALVTRLVACRCSTAATPIAPEVIPEPISRLLTAGQACGRSDSYCLSLR